MNARLLQLLSPADSPGHWPGYLAAASCLHVALALTLAREPEPVLTIPATEVELEPPPEPAPPAPAPPAPPPTAATRPAPAQPRLRRAPDPPAPARAGALLTAPETPAPQIDAPVRFVSDPSGRGYGTGIVARGAGVDHGESGAVTAKPLPHTTREERITPAERLQQTPSLLGDGCRGFFPDHARVDRGVVSLIATVRSSGAVAQLEIEAETPAGEGFANAARACLTQRRFSPARDDAGKPAAARTRVNVRFAR